MHPFEQNDRNQKPSKKLNLNKVDYIIAIVSLVLIGLASLLLNIAPHVVYEDFDKTKDRLLMNIQQLQLHNPELKQACYDQETLRIEFTATAYNSPEIREFIAVKREDRVHLSLYESGKLVNFNNVPTDMYERFKCTDSLSTVPNWQVQGKMNPLNIIGISIIILGGSGVAYFLYQYSKKRI